MRVIAICATMVAALTAGALEQQPSLGVPLPPLPLPELTSGDRPSDYLRAAQSALVAGRTGEAESALEMAQTRMLDRSVPLGQTGNPSDNPTVGEITQARTALAAHDRKTCQQIIETAITSATAQGL